MALEAMWPDNELKTPSLGGFYVPDVLAYRRSDGVQIKPFRAAMVHVALERPPASTDSDDTWEAYERCTQQIVCLT